MAIAILDIDAPGLDVRRERFARDVKVLTLIRNSGVVEIIDADGSGDTPYLVMELLDGQSLVERLAEPPPVGLKELTDHVSVVLNALAAVHAAGVVHGDIEPGNIMLVRGPTGPRRAKVIGFGVSRACAREGIGAAEATLDPDEVRRTWAFAAPEQIARAPVDHRADLYSMGVVLYSAIAGRRPYTGATAELLKAAIRAGGAPALSTIRPEIGAALSDLVEHAMQVDPAARFADAKEMRGAITRALLGVPAATKLVLPVGDRWSDTPLELPPAPEAPAGRPPTLARVELPERKRALPATPQLRPKTPAASTEGGPPATVRLSLDDVEVVAAAIAERSPPPPPTPPTAPAASTADATMRLSLGDVEVIAATIAGRSPPPTPIAAEPPAVPAAAPAATETRSETAPSSDTSANAAESAAAGPEATTEAPAPSAPTTAAQDVRGIETEATTLEPSRIADGQAFIAALGPPQAASGEPQSGERPVAPGKAEPETATAIEAPPIDEDAPTSLLPRVDDDAPTSALPQVPVEAPSSAHRPPTYDEQEESDIVPPLVGLGVPWPKVAIGALAVVALVTVVWLAFGRGPGESTAATPPSTPVVDEPATPNAPTVAEPAPSEPVAVEPAPAPGEPAAAPSEPVAVEPAPAPSEPVAVEPAPAPSEPVAVAPAPVPATRPRVTQPRVRTTSAQTSRPTTSGPRTGRPTKRTSIVRDPGF